MSVLGNKVRVTLVTNEVHEGLIFAYEPLLGILALQSSPSIQGQAQGQDSERPNFHIIRIPGIKDVTTLSTHDSTSEDSDAAVKKDGAANGESSYPGKRNYPATLQPVGYVPIDKVLAREQALLKSEAERVAKIGIGVSDEAQELFYALDKTLPTRWKGSTIIVMDEVKINPPYTSDDVQGSSTTNTAVVSRVKKVVELERKKLLASKEGKN
ncbi:hypothetical protein HDU97_006392 [Phlyctochytrium planicorne]|nr:hypothetical protein HDU97_006392 [Phlyctochytrium planicorne]